MLSVRKIAQVIEGFGHQKLPSGCQFYNKRDGKDVLVIVPYNDSVFPSFFYLREEEGGDIIECFRAIRPDDLLMDRTLACPSRAV